MKSIEDLAPQLAEFEHRVRAGDYDGACRVLEPIDLDYLHRWGHYARLIELREKLLKRLTDPDLRAANLGGLGIVYAEFGGQVERAIKFLEDALTMAREIGGHRNEGDWLGYLGWAYRSLGQIKRTIDLYEQVLEIFRHIGDRKKEGTWLGDLGIVFQSIGHITRAIELIEEALAIARETGDRKGEGMWLGRLGNTYIALGKFDQAVESLENALSIDRETGYRVGESYRLNHLGNAYLALGQPGRAIKFYKEGLIIAREIGYRQQESYQLLGLGKALLTVGELSEAHRHCAEALALDVLETSYSVALVLGITFLQQRDPAAGETFADATARCQVMLDKTASLYEPRYALEAALVGSAVCNPRWAEEGERAGLLAPALEEYRRALENCAAPGVVRNALRDLELIRAAAIEGLEAVFQLLEDYAVRSADAGDTPGPARGHRRSAGADERLL